MSNDLTKTCVKCRQPFLAYWRGVDMPARCRPCEYRYSHDAGRRIRKGRETTPSQAAREASKTVRPKHVLGEHFTETWFHTQQSAFATLMEKLGIPKTGPKPNDAHSAAGDRPSVGLGARF